MEDKVFGALSFNVGWEKEEKLFFWGKEYKVTIRTSSKQGELPSEIQRQTYLSFESDIEKFSSTTLPLVKEYIISYFQEIVQEFGTSVLNDPLSLITPEEILFFQNGKFALICDTKWSEVGMAVLYNDGSYVVNDSYILEFEY